MDYTVKFKFHIQDEFFKNGDTMIIEAPNRSQALVYAINEMANDPDFNSTGNDIESATVVY